MRTRSTATTTPTTTEEQPDDLLNPNATAPAAAPSDPNAERMSVIREINTYNRRFSGEPRPVRQIETLRGDTAHIFTAFWNFDFGVAMMFMKNVLNKNC